MNRPHKRERRWQSSQERARVAAELIEEAASLTDTAAIATPLEVARAELPPPLRVALPASPGETQPRASLDEERAPESPAPPPEPPEPP
ncbi:MAG: hypothetical protein Q8Q14_06690, partial [Gemmatimonadales bacterium]|nr:hypothetical protein [Gemmatimonadales bacterium]